jgi:serine/threonine protein phosphatase PrpC
VTAHTVLGQCINQRRDGVAGFDAFAANPAQGLFALCDGANSCPDSGQAALWLSQQLVYGTPCGEAWAEFESHIFQLHREMLERFPETASTAVWARVSPHGLALSSVGDSSLRVYRRSWAGWGPWQAICAMPRDIDAQGNPRQLIGSEVLDTVHHQTLPARDTLLTLMMSDGPANILSDDMVEGVLRTLKRQAPSAHDLDYLCRKLVEEALNLGCQDDASAAMVWAQWP